MQTAGPPENHRRSAQWRSYELLMVIIRSAQVPCGRGGRIRGMQALGRLHDYLLGWPGQTAALLAVELCSLNWPTSGITPADMVASGLFGDGAVALIARGGQADAVFGPGPGPRVIASRSVVYPDSGDALGWRLGTDCFRIVLKVSGPA
jgi:alkylresorcinol/alkylpyrone synthase